MGQRATEDVFPGVNGIDTWDSLRILKTLQKGQEQALKAVAKAHAAIAGAADEIEKRLRAGGRLFYAGAGTSIRIGVQDGTELPATFGLGSRQLGYLIAGGRPAIFATRAAGEDDVKQARRDAVVVGKGDVLIAIAASGRTPYAIAAAEVARKKGAFVVAMVNNVGSALAAVSHVEILLESGPEVIAGSTRMGAGTAQKAALNLLSTLVNIRLGAVHDGLMVNLEAGNGKLKARTEEIVARIAQCDVMTARTALQKSKGHLKKAVLLCCGAASVRQAQRLLVVNGDHLRGALRDLAKPD